MHKFRFVHASRVQLDSPVIIPGECSPEARQLAEDATILAFRTLVENCIERDVDLLLLTGDTFGASLVTLREQMELEQGLQRLSDHDITVVVTPGPEDPAVAWREHMRLPPGVILADGSHSDPIRVQRNGQCVAVVFPVAIIDAAGQPHGCKLPHVGDNVYHIGLVGTGGADSEYLDDFDTSAKAGSIHLQLDTRGTNSAEQAIFDAVNRKAVNYLAIGLTGSRRDWSVGSITLHNPGPLQSLDAAITGPCGASLISIDHEGRSQIEPLPCARIRWESLSIEGGSLQSIEDLALEMEQTLEGVPTVEHEELWILRWRLDASVHLLNEVRRTSLDDLWKLIDTGAQRRPACHHILQLAERWEDASLSEERPHHGDRFEDHLRSDLEQLIARVTHSEWGSTPWGRRIAREVGKLSPAILSTRVRETVASALRQAGDARD